jgi:uncharacterized GH25 family protein
MIASIHVFRTKELKMSKKIVYLSFILLCLSCPALAHDFWAGVDKAVIGQPASVFLGHSHGFPLPEEIKPDVYAERFNPLALIGAKGEIKLKQGTQAQSFVSEEPLTAGSYYVLASSKPGFSSRTPSGWTRKSKTEDPTAVSCTFGSNFGKNLINLDPAGADSFVTKPVGHKLEIVPQVNPDKIKAGDKFPVIVLFDGKPFAGASVGAFFAGFTEHNDALAFSATSKKDGLVEIIPLKSGSWLAKATYTNPYSDEKACDREVYNATLAFTIQ